MDFKRADEVKKQGEMARVAQETLHWINSVRIGMELARVKVQENIKKHGRPFRISNELKNCDVGFEELDRQDYAISVIRAREEAHAAGQMLDSGELYLDEETYEWKLREGS